MQSESSGGDARRASQLLHISVGSLLLAPGKLCGAVAGSVLPINTTGIDFSMTALFTVIVVNQWMDTKEHKPAIIGGAVGVLCLILLGADAFLLPALTITAVILLGVKKKCYIPSES